MRGDTLRRAAKIVVETIGGIITLVVVLIFVASIFGKDTPAVVSVAAILYGLVSVMVLLFQYIRKALTASVKIRLRGSEVEVSDFSHEELQRVISGLEIKEDPKSDAASGSGNGQRP